MKTLFTGKGSAGSWKIRGEQLASAMVADTAPAPTERQLKGYDTTIIVKKFTPAIRNLSGRLIWDIVDYWPQPAGNQWDRERLVSHILKTAEANHIDYMIAATEQMRRDLGADFTLYHHHRPGIEKNPIRKKVNAIAYEGNHKYLGRWWTILHKICFRHGISVLINPDHLADADIVVALRDHPHKGYATDNWKSNVKLANAKGSGTPIICNREAGYYETGNCGEVYADSDDELEKAIIALLPQEERAERAAKLHATAYSVETAAGDLSAWIDKL